MQRRDGNSVIKLFGLGAALAVLAVAAPALAAPAMSLSRTHIEQAWTPTMTQAAPITGARDIVRSRPLSDVVPMRIVVGLGMRDRAGADLLVRRQYAPGSPAFHRWLTPSQFTAMFNPTYGQAAAVAAYLQQRGFLDVSIEPNNLMVTGTAPASRVGAAFHTTIRALQI